MVLRQLVFMLLAAVGLFSQSAAATLQLSSGWNLVPVPVADGTSVATWQSSQNLSGLTKIWTYDGGWSQYVPGEDNSGSGRFSTFSTNRGYWFLMGAAGSIEFSESLSPLQVNRSGWTLAGFGNTSKLSFASEVLTTSTIDEAHGPENIAKVWGYQPGAEGWKYYANGDSSSTTETMNPGQAYWFLVQDSGSKEVSEASPMTITPAGAGGTAALVIGGATQLTPPSESQTSGRLRMAFQTVQSAASGENVVDKCSQTGDVIGYARAYSINGTKLSSDSLSLVRCRVENGQVMPVNYQVGFDSAGKQYLATNPDVANNLVIKVELNTGQSMKSIVADKFQNIDVNSQTSVTGETVDASSTVGVAMAAQELAKKAGVPSSKLNLGEENSGVTTGVDLNSSLKKKDIVLGSFSRMVSGVSTGQSVFTSLVQRISDINDSNNAANTSTNSAASQVLGMFSGEDTQLSTEALSNAKKAASRGMKLLASKERSARNSSVSTQGSKLDQLTENLLKHGVERPALMNTADILSRSMGLTDATSGDKLIGTVAQKNLDALLNRLDPEGLASDEGETMALDLASKAVGFPDSLMNKLAQNSNAAGHFAGIVGQSNSLLRSIESKDQSRSSTQRVLQKSQAAASKLTGAQALFSEMAKSAPDNETLNTIMAEAISASSEETNASKEIFSRISEIKTAVETGSLKVDFGTIANRARGNAADLKSVALAIAKNSGESSDAARVLKEMNSILSPSDLREILSDDQIANDFGLATKIFADAGPELYAAIRDSRAEFSLDASASFDPRGADLSYFWSEIASDGTTSAIATAQQTSIRPTLTLTGMSANRVVKTYRLTVSDTNTGRVAEDDVTVVLESARPPVIQAPRFISVQQNELFFIEAFDSFDPEGFDNELTYRLTGSCVINQDSQIPGLFEVTCANKGREKLTLSVTADTVESATATSTTTINVRVEGSLPPIADAGYDLIVSSDEVVDGFVELPNFSFSPSGQEPLSYEWSPGNIFSTQSGQDYQSRHPVLTTTRPGEYNVTLQVTDQAGEKSRDSITIVVQRGLPPVADAGLPIVVRGSGEKPIHLDGSFSFSFVDDSSLNWSWSSQGQNIATGTGTPVTSTTINLDNYSQKTRLVYDLTVNDANGSDSSSVEVFLVPEKNGLTPPIVIVDRFPEQESYSPGDRVLLNAGASFSPDFAPVNFDWRVQSSSIVPQVRGQKGEILDLQVPANFAASSVPVVLEVINSQSSSVKTRKEFSFKVVSDSQPPVAAIAPQVAEFVVEFGSNVNDTRFVDCFDSFSSNGTGVKCNWNLGPGLQAVGSLNDSQELEFKAGANVSNDMRSYVDLTVVDSQNSSLSATARLNVQLLKRFESGETLPLFLDAKPELQFVRNREFPIFRPEKNELVYFNFGPQDTEAKTIRMFGYVENPNITDNSQAATVSATLYDYANGSKGNVLHNFTVENFGPQGGPFLDFGLDSHELSNPTTRALLEIQAQSAAETKMVTYAIRLNEATGGSGQVSNALQAKPKIVFAKRPLANPTDFFSGNFAQPVVYFDVDGFDSVNQNGGPVEYRWQWRWADNHSQTSRVSLFNSKTAVLGLEVELPTTTARTLEVGLEVADAVSGSVSATEWVTFKNLKFSEEVPPVADPGFVPQPLFMAADQDFIEVPLDASLSFSPSGAAIQSVTWTHEFGFNVFGESGTAATTNTTFAMARLGKGRHKFKLIVTDSNGRRDDAVLDVEVIQEEVFDNNAEFVIEGFADAFPKDGFVNEPNSIDTEFFLNLGPTASSTTTLDPQLLKRVISFQQSDVATAQGDGFYSAEVTSSVTGFHVATVAAFYDVNDNDSHDTGEVRREIEIPMTFRRNTVENLFVDIEVQEEIFLPQGSQTAALPVTFFVNTDSQELQSKNAYLEFKVELLNFNDPSANDPSAAQFVKTTSDSGMAMTQLTGVGSGSYGLNVFVWPREVGTGEYLSDGPIASAFRDVRVFGNEASVLVRLLDPRGKLAGPNASSVDLMASVYNSTSQMQVASSFVDFIGFGDYEFFPMSVPGHLISSDGLELRVTRMVSGGADKVETQALDSLRLGDNYVEMNLAQVNELTVKANFIVDDTILADSNGNYDLTFSQRIMTATSTELRPLNMVHMGSRKPAVFSTGTSTPSTPNFLEFVLPYGPEGLLKTAGTFEVELVATLEGTDEDGNVIEREDHFNVPVTNDFIFWSPIDFFKERPLRPLSADLLVDKTFIWRQSGFNFGTLKFEADTATVLDHGHTRNFNWELRQGRLYLQEVFDDGFIGESREFSAFEIRPDGFAGQTRYVFENGQVDPFAEPFAFVEQKPFKVRRTLSLTDSMPNTNEDGINVRFSSALPAATVTQIHPVDLMSFMGMDASTSTTNPEMDPAALRPGGYIVFRDLDGQALVRMHTQLGKVYEGGGNGFVDLDPSLAEHRESFADNLHSFIESVGMQKIVTLNQGVQTSCVMTAPIPGVEACQSVGLHGLFPNGYEDHNYMVYFLPILDAPQYEGDLDSRLVLRHSSIGFSPQLQLERDAMLMPNHGRIRMAEAPNDAIYFELGGKASIQEGAEYRLMEFGRQAPAHLANQLPSSDELIRGVRVGDLSMDQGFQLSNLQPQPQLQYLHEQEFVEHRPSNAETIIFARDGASGSVFEIGAVHEEHGMPEFERGEYLTQPGQTAAPIAFPILSQKNVGAGTADPMLQIGESVETTLIETYLMGEPGDANAQIGYNREELRSTVLAYISEMSFAIIDYSTVPFEVETEVILEELVLLREESIMYPVEYLSGGVNSRWVRSQQPNAWPGSRETNYMLLAKGIGPVLMSSIDVEARFDDSLGQFVPERSSDHSLMSAFEVPAEPQTQQETQAFRPHMVQASMLSVNELISTTLGVLQREPEDSFSSEFEFMLEQGSNNSGTVIIRDFDKGPHGYVRDPNSQNLVVEETETMQWSMQSDGTIHIDDEGQVLVLQPVLNRGLPGSMASLILYPQGHPEMVEMEFELFGPIPGETGPFAAGEAAVMVESDNFGFAEDYSKVRVDAFVRRDLTQQTETMSSGFGFDPKLPHHNFDGRVIIHGPTLPPEGLVMEGSGTDIVDQLTFAPEFQEYAEACGVNQWCPSSADISQLPTGPLVFNVRFEGNGSVQWNVRLDSGPVDTFDLTAEDFPSISSVTGAELATPIIVGTQLTNNTTLTVNTPVGAEFEDAGVHLHLEGYDDGNPSPSTDSHSIYADEQNRVTVGSYILNNPSSYDAIYGSLSAFISSWGQPRYETIYRVEGMQNSSSAGTTAP